MTIKLGRMVTCDGGTPTSRSCDILIMWSRDKWRRNYTWTSTILIANKLCRVVTYGRITTHTKLHGLLITWSRDKCKTLYLHFCSAYDHKAGQSNNLPWGDPTLKVTWPFDYVVTWQMKKIMSDLHNTSDHQIWRLEDPTHQVMGSFDHVITWQIKKTSICISATPMAAKLGRAET